VQLCTGHLEVLCRAMLCQFTIVPPLVPPCLNWKSVQLTYSGNWRNIVHTFTQYSITSRCRKWPSLNNISSSDLSTGSDLEYEWGLGKKQELHKLSPAVILIRQVHGI
jgi:hypothetical protein